MFRRKKPVWTEHYCKMLESVRLAVEVLSGQRVRWKHFDFNTTRGQLHIGEKTTDIAVLFDAHDKILFTFDSGQDLEWYVARFDTDTQVRVINERRALHEAPIPPWIVGHSAIDRWEEPLFA